MVVRALASASLDSQSPCKVLHTKGVIGVWKETVAYFQENTVRECPLCFEERQLVTLFCFSGKEGEGEPTHFYCMKCLERISRVTKPLLCPFDREDKSTVLPASKKELKLLKDRSNRCFREFVQTHLDLSAKMVNRGVTLTDMIHLSSAERVDLILHAEKSSVFLRSQLGA